MSFGEPVRDKPFGEEWKTKPLSELTPQEKAKALAEQQAQRRAIEASLKEPAPRKPVATGKEIGL